MKIPEIEHNGTYTLPALLIIISRSTTQCDCVVPFLLNISLLYGTVLEMVL
jgi:hypothetical protein